MEPIKITDKLTLRQEALRMAMNNGHEYRNPAYLFEDAKRIAEYLQGESILPEYVDTSKMFADVMEKMNERWHQPNPWISADSEMKPYEDSLVVAHSPNGRTDVLRYHDEVFIDELNQEHCIDGWMPIPPFTQPTL